MSSVSICIPAYQQPYMLKRCLDSILAQSFTDYEVIITDDSPDQSVKNVVSSYCDSRINYIKNSKRLGAPENWNESIRQATSRYIKIMHHDDWFSSSESLFAFVKALDDNPEAVLAFSDSQNYDASESPRNVSRPTNKQLSQLRNTPHCLFLGNFIGAPSATIFRSRSSPTFNKQLIWLVDVSFYIDILSGKGKAVYIPNSLVCITSQSESQMTRQCENNRSVELPEYLYQYKRMSPLRRLRYPYIHVIMQLCRKYQVFWPSDILNPSLPVEPTLSLYIVFILMRILKLARDNGLIERYRKIKKRLCR